MQHRVSIERSGVHYTKRHGKRTRGFAISSSLYASCTCVSLCWLGFGSLLAIGIRQQRIQRRTDAPTPTPSPSRGWQTTWPAPRMACCTVLLANAVLRRSCAPVAHFEHRSLPPPSPPSSPQHCQRLNIQFRRKSVPHTESRASRELRAASPERQQSFQSGDAQAHRRRGWCSFAAVAIFAASARQYLVYA